MEELATSAELCDPAQLAFDSSRRLIRRRFWQRPRAKDLVSEGIIATVAGSGQRVPVGLTGGGTQLLPLMAHFPAATAAQPSTRHSPG